MPAEDKTNNGGIIRWQHLQSAMDALRREVKSDMAKLEEAQRDNSDEIAEMKASLSSIKTELRIWGLIALALLVAILGLVLNHLATAGP